LNKSDKSTQSALQKLSSGKRINSAKDDAAGLAIALRFAAQIAGANQAARNANDGISMVQTAEGGLQEVTDNLQRMRDLAVQSANASNSASDREALNLEYSQRQAEVQRTVESTDFNGHKVLNDSANLEFQVGPNADPAVNKTIVSTSNVTADADVKAALTESELSTQDSSTDAIGKIDAALQRVNEERARLGATQNRLESTVNNLSVSSENSSAARSRIEDTDYAKQTAELTRSLILNKAGIGALAHSKVNTALVAGLLNKSF
ncbi:MAG: flagellin, partial [Gammaproteobacteria bacterium]|nr:flagellin [Gammaproteobacteria bacterium]